MIMTYLLYLRLSGQFHSRSASCTSSATTFRRPRQVSPRLGVADFWRRINIYWKDFIVKLFYLPVFFRLRRTGELRAAAIATVVAFFATWVLHSWQWHYFGTLLTWPDTLFWAILGGMMVFATVQETRRGGRPVSVHLGEDLRNRSDLHPHRRPLVPVAGVDPEAWWSPVICEVVDEASGR